jgi:hypothetical protein
MLNAESEAKRFFAEKVIQRAESEGVPLTEAERRMLLWSESDPEGERDPQLSDALAAQMSDEEYEAKIAGLLAREFAADVGRDSNAKDTWRQARAVLGQGDHYILVMIDRAVGRKLKPSWRFWR